MSILSKNQQLRLAKILIQLAELAKALPKPNPPVGTKPPVAPISSPAAIKKPSGPAASSFGRPSRVGQLSPRVINKWGEHPEGKYVGVEHEGGLVWRNNNEISANHDNIIREKAPAFIAAQPALHRPLVRYMIDSIAKNPNRHKIPSRDKGVEVPRARHLAALLMGKKDKVNMDLKVHAKTRAPRVNLQAVRHSEEGDKNLGVKWDEHVVDTWVHHADDGAPDVGHLRQVKPKAEWNPIPVTRLNKP